MSTASRHLRLAAIAIVPVVAALVLGQFATFPNLSWYAGLAKPSFNPPNWIFGPVWTTLYALMAVAVWRLLRHPASSPRQLALSLFFAQLAFNAAWSWMFFAAHSPALGLVNIVPQFLLVVATVVATARVDRLAALALAPLAAWVGFATILNYTVWSLNG